jgi:short subunit dehydrogenase-like uncharacterized protein
MSDKVLIIGATGRVGSEVARRLDRADVSLVLFGRDLERLEALAKGLKQTAQLRVGTLGDLKAFMVAHPPAVVVHTVGPFTATAATVIDALPTGTHYLDLSNEYTAFESVFAHDEAAQQAGQTLVTGAGFGVIATESVLAAICAGQPTPTHVRVDALPSVATGGDTIGAALAGSIVRGLPIGRLQVRGDKLVSSRFDDTPAELVTPDGDRLTTVNFPSGDLFAAWRSSHASNLIAASSEMPTGRAIRYALPFVGLLARSARVRKVLTQRIANAKLPIRPRPRVHSWGHAMVTFPDGNKREGWLRTDDAMEFTFAAAAEVAQRLLAGEGRPGAHTPCALFGSEIAKAAGGELLIATQRV